MPDPLAELADLQLRDLATDPDVQTAAEAFLESASTAVREAAGVPISRETFTVTIPGAAGKWLDVPGKPVVSVSDVSIDDSAVTDWKLVGGRLWRACGWLLRSTLTNERFYGHYGDEPTNVTMTVTGGLTSVPGDIVELVCQMVGSALNKLEEGYEATSSDVASEAVDDYRVQYITNEAVRLASVMELPSASRERLAARFGGGAAVVGSSR